MRYDFGMRHSGVATLGLVFLGSVSGCPGGGSAEAEGAGSTSAATSGLISSSSGVVADSSGAVSSSSSGGDTAALPPGQFQILTYNIAGLPQGISSSNPEEFIPQISPLLNDFDMVLVQEDFWYHADLIAELTLPNASVPYSEMPDIGDIGDGLNRFGIHPFADHERVAWYACNGLADCASDCLATKGWSFARTTLAEGVELDVYNLHMEAGGCPEDIEIRTNAAQDLVDAIAQRSADRALVVAGDFNLRGADPEDEEPLRIIVEGVGLTDACHAVGCDHEQLIDHVMVRSSEALEIEVLNWWIAEQFVDVATGDPLSDHPAVAAELRYVPQ